MVDDPGGRRIGDLPGPGKAAPLVEAVKAGLTTVPVAGAVTAEIFGYMIQPRLDRRRDEWLNDIANAVNELWERPEGLDPEGLADNPEFLSAVLSATSYAIKTHLEEKRTALRNGIINVALERGALDTNEQMVFLSLVDDLTPLHVQVLRLLQHPQGWFEINGLTPPDFAFAGSISVMIRSGIPELEGRDDLVTQLLRELYADGLSLIDKSSVVSGNSAFVSRTTALGNRFLEFITAPPETPPE